MRRLPNMQAAELRDVLTRLSSTEQQDWTPEDRAFLAQVSQVIARYVVSDNITVNSRVYRGQNWADATGETSEWMLLVHGREPIASRQVLLWKTRAGERWVRKNVTAACQPRSAAVPAPELDAFIQDAYELAKSLGAFAPRDVVELQAPVQPASEDLTARSSRREAGAAL